MYLDLDLNLVHINMQHYPVIGEWSEVDWLDPLLWESPKSDQANNHDHHKKGLVKPRKKSNKE